ncbi:hypothetical protein LSAT2_028776 [Lamellibrachia satsuma]|nr:hypothetical protein LSAT2_028776 [Lamellibrachia satsuma]
MTPARLLTPVTLRYTFSGPPSHLPRLSRTHNTEIVSRSIAIRTRRPYRMRQRDSREVKGQRRDLKCQVRCFISNTRACIVRPTIRKLKDLDSLATLSRSNDESEQRRVGATMSQSNAESEATMSQSGAESEQR